MGKINSSSVEYNRDHHVALLCESIIIRVIIYKILLRYQVKPNKVLSALGLALALGTGASHAVNSASDSGAKPWVDKTSTPAAPSQQLLQAISAYWLDVHP